MTNNEILQKIIKRAVKNGYKSSVEDFWFTSPLIIYKNLSFYYGNYDFDKCLSVRDIIFSHDFAKAFLKMSL